MKSKIFALCYVLCASVPFAMRSNAVGALDFQLRIGLERSQLIGKICGLKDTPATFQCAAQNEIYIWLLACADLAPNDQTVRLKCFDTSLKDAKLNYEHWKKAHPKPP